MPVIDIPDLELSKVAMLAPDQLDGNYRAITRWGLAKLVELMSTDDDQPAEKDQPDA